MSAELFAAALALILGGLPIIAALALWPRIKAWCEESMLPWVERHLPNLAPLVRAAFAVLDQVVTAAQRLAWQSLREYLLHQVLTLLRLSPSEWVRRITTWVLTLLPGGQRVPVQVVTEGVCSWDELPAEARSQWLREGNNNHKINVTEMRDKELAVVC